MISIVIPIFNEEENLPNLFDRIIGASSTFGEDFELILVDDGSIDRSIEIMKGLAAKDRRVKVVKLSRNFGHQPAISAGIKVAKGDALVIMDGDLQDPPEELHRFLAKWREGYHVVYAIRTKRKENIFKRLAYALFYRVLAMVSDIAIPLDSGDFCVMDRKVTNVLNFEMPEQIRFIRGLRAYAGFRQIGVSYERAERAAGDVKYTFSKLINLALDGLFGFSYVPLRLATYTGFLIALPSFFLGFVYLLQKLLGFDFIFPLSSTPKGFATLAFGQFFIGGIILIMLGILGEYIGRIYIEVKKRPFYVIEEIIETKD